MAIVDILKHRGIITIIVYHVLLVPGYRCVAFSSSTRKNFPKRNSNSKQFPPLNLPPLPQSSESQPIALPFLPSLDIPVGGTIGPLSGTMGKINKQQMGPLYHLKWFQDTIQVNSSPFISSNPPPCYFKKRSRLFSRNGQ